MMDKLRLTFLEIKPRDLSMNCYGYEIHEHEHLVVEKMFFVGGTELNLHLLEIFYCIYIWQGV